MKVDIKRHATDIDMWELWQLDGNTGEQKYLMAIIHSDLLEQDVNPINFEETQMSLELIPRVERGDEMCPYCYGSSLTRSDEHD